jgi:ribonucleoside-diphosphate reductase subunit M2
MTVLLHARQFRPPFDGRSLTRSPSPTSSVWSQATSIDDVGEMPRIDQHRPVYHSSGSLEDQMGLTDMERPGREDRISKDGEGRKFPEEEEEDILRESNARFVLFPIRYREVRCQRPCGLFMISYG